MIIANLTIIGRGIPCDPLKFKRCVRSIFPISSFISSHFPAISITILPVSSFFSSGIPLIIRQFLPLYWAASSAANPNSSICAGSSRFSSCNFFVVSRVLGWPHRICWIQTELISQSLQPFHSIHP